MHKLSITTRQALRARAHALSPVVMISEKGLSETVLKEIEHSLNAHELIKIRIFSDDRDERKAILELICAQLNCLLVQQIGKVLVVYRENLDVAETPAPRAPRTPRKNAKKGMASHRRAIPGTKSAISRNHTATRRRKVTDK